MSAESGIPKTRDDGLWKNSAHTNYKNFDSFMKNPDLVWEW
ncbi:MAG: hypothetical protein IPG53_23825 [Ignavibacteriales bacterium]|nr:hypothetical protein [Ignavibacteriales bacterium]